MTTKTVAQTAALAKLPARDRLLAAAEELFYAEGVSSVGIDRVIERAGVAKASLYSNFKNKDDLVRSYLAARRDARQARIQERLAHHSKPRDKLLAVFDLLGESFADPRYRGCAFVRASAEMRPDSSARGVCGDSRKWLRSLWVELAKEAGAARPEQLAHQLALLYDGAAVSAQMDGDPRAATMARSAAAQLIDAACLKRAPR